ncbi:MULTISPECIES: hypothetical protein [Pseudomonas]|jgi:hypothetical protein|uniref:DUF3077 domain-containing protein n=2 Tax=Pseudomonas putida TaxID=303 RepID=A0A379KG59_PSEPU|nr:MULTISPECIES: hypothetical protein [Pseudomonas]QPN45314.1 hypothetical protein I5S86_28000 [Priestia aryabhattai]KAF1306270.1 hypothetical protein BLX42_23500 [Pseudomonas sp. SG-MS2]MBG6125676.1 hypothetical protein [Pseudomonas sp. M2]MBM7398396.1 hypothetical protein [Pseudomonas sp. M5]NSX21098.1 hypothetical protein [Pseudomonas putida]
MKKLVPDPPPSALLLLDPPAISLPEPPNTQECNALICALTLTIKQTSSVLLDSPQGPVRDAMGMNIRLLCRMINALNEHAGAQGASQ